MLDNAIIKAFVPTVKPQEAKQFYSEVLGFELVSEDNYALEFEANDILLRVTIVPKLTPHPFTILGWNIGDIEATIRQLNEKGIVCEKYKGMEQDDLGVWQSPGGSQVAWFKDPDGNVLSLTQ